jgi:hypothetical protein
MLALPVWTRKIKALVVLLATLVSALSNIFLASLLQAGIVHWCWHA